MGFLQTVTPSSPQGKAVVLLLLLNFTGNDVNTAVQTVEDMVKEQWFVEAIAEEPDVFVLIR
ncbi:hypothetical protein P692DRAFT_20875533 [Suillus brevipes Sb2]|nr:hypothetical protein P692DRAFT_20875533 [Suillus brevipes Sb2]